MDNCIQLDCSYVRNPYYLPLTTRLGGAAVMALHCLNTWHNNDQIRENVGL